MVAVKKCQVVLSPKPSPKTERRQVAANDRSAETKDDGTRVAEVKETPSKSPDQAAFDSDSSSGDGSGMYITVPVCASL